MADGEGTGSNAIWAIALIIVVAIIAGVVYYSGILKQGSKKSEIDINVTAPAREVKDKGGDQRRSAPAGIQLPTYEGSCLSVWVSTLRHEIFETSV